MTPVKRYNKNNSASYLICTSKTIYPLMKQHKLALGKTFGLLVLLDCDTSESTLLYYFVCNISVAFESLVRTSLNTAKKYHM